MSVSDDDELVYSTKKECLRHPSALASPKDWRRDERWQGVVLKPGGLYRRAFDNHDKSWYDDDALDLLLL
ncbi:MAG: hypothetical protein WBW48_11055 [Anaerolineae bacterium]